LLEGLDEALELMAACGVLRVHLDGRFVTDKDCPNDIDGCYHLAEDITDEDLERWAPIFPPNPANRAEAKRHAYAYTPEAHIGGESLSITFCPQPVVYESVHRAVHAVARRCTLALSGRSRARDHRAGGQRAQTGPLRSPPQGALRQRSRISAQFGGQFSQPSRLVPGDPLPEDLEILPLPDKLEAYKACKRAVETGGRGGASPRNRVHACTLGKNARRSRTDFLRNYARELKKYCWYRCHHRFGDNGTNGTNGNS
jgi:hypothetical protein